jgi:hypothetical protein
MPEVTQMQNSLNTTCWSLKEIKHIEIINCFSLVLFHFQSSKMKTDVYGILAGLAGGIPI